MHTYITYIHVNQAALCNAFEMEKLLRKTLYNRSKQLLSKYEIILHFLVHSVSVAHVCMYVCLLPVVYRGVYHRRRPFMVLQLAVQADHTFFTYFTLVILALALPCREGIYLGGPHRLSGGDGRHHFLHHSRQGSVIVSF